MEKEPGDVRGKHPEDIIENRSVVTFKDIFGVTQAQAEVLDREAKEKRQAQLAADRGNGKWENL